MPAGSLGIAEIMLMSVLKCSDASHALVPPPQPPAGSAVLGEARPVSRAMNSSCVGEALHAQSAVSQLAIPDGEVLSLIDSC